MRTYAKFIWASRRHDALESTQNLSAFYGDFQALFGINVAVDQGETVAIIRVQTAPARRHFYAQSPALSRARRRWSCSTACRSGTRPRTRSYGPGIAMVPEGRRLFEPFGRRKSTPGRPQRATDDSTIKRVYELFPRLYDLRHLPSTALSGGQQQMTAVGEALYVQSAIITL